MFSLLGASPRWGIGALLLFCYCVLLCVGSVWLKLLHRGEHCELVRYLFGRVCYECVAFEGLCFYWASIFAIGGLVASLSFWFCLSVWFCFVLLWYVFVFACWFFVFRLPPPMLARSVVSFILIMFRYVVLPLLLLICWLLGCSFILVCLCVCLFVLCFLAASPDVGLKRCFV